MPLQGDELWRSRDDILTSFIAAFQAAIPDVWLDEDGNLRILLEIEAGQIEGLYVANQILLEDMFIQTASYAALLRHGEQYGLPLKTGTFAVGDLLFSGQGGIYIGIGAEVAYDPGSGADILYFVTTADGTIPNPGIPTAPFAADGGTGVIAAGTYEYVVTYLTAAGETLASDPSNAITIVDNHQIDVTIPLGGPGTIGRNIYRSIDGGNFQLIQTVADNTTTSVVDNVAAPGVTLPPTVSTAEAILLAAQSQDTGLAYNAVAGAITVLSSVPNGITTVTNPSPFTGGSDQESYDDYRQRLLIFIRSPVTGSENDLITWAEAVDGVDTATVFPNDNLGVSTPGHVTIRIAGVNGSVPTSDVIDAVATAIAAQDLANITIHVGTFTPVTIDVTVTTTLDSNYALADVSAGIEQAITDYINSVDVGGTAYISGIIAAVMSVTGVLDVDVTAPTSNQSSSATSKFAPGTITVS